MPLDPRSGRPRLRVTRALRAQQLPCHLCGNPIDYSLDSERHPLAFTVDELIPISPPFHGDPLDPANLAPAHRVCNGSRGVKPITPAVRRQCATVYRKHATTQRRTLSAAW